MLFKLLNVANAQIRYPSRDATIYMDRAMKMVGWVPPSNGIWRYIYFIWTVISTILAIIYLPWGFVFSYITLIKSFTPGEFLTSLQVALNVFGSSFKASMTFLAIWRFNKVKQILDHMDMRSQADIKRLDTNHAVERCNYAFMLYTTLYSGYTTATLISGLLDGRPPWQLYIPMLDWRIGPAQMWMASLFEYFVMSVRTMQDQLSAVYPVIYLIILRSHIQLLNERIRNLRTNPMKSSEENYEELVACIMDHRNIFLYCNLLRPVISATIFAQFILMGVVLGLSMVNVFFFSDFWAGLSSAVFIAALLLETFPFSYLCDLLIEDCIGLSYAIFQSDWIDADRRYKSTLFFFMHNVQRIITFTAGGIFTISTNTNISVAKLGFSVLTIVKGMDIAEKFKAT